jgi:hypothetical protein
LFTFCVRIDEVKGLVRADPDADRAGYLLKAEVTLGSGHLASGSIRLKYLLTIGEIR